MDPFYILANAQAATSSVTVRGVFSWHATAYLRIVAD